MLKIMEYVGQQIGPLLSLINPQYVHEYFTVGNVPITCHFLACIFKGIHISQIESSLTAIHNLTFSQIAVGWRTN